MNAATMKRVIIATFTILCMLTATAQDIIVKIDGDTLRVYDLKINAKFITYRERPGKESPSRRIGKAKVLSVKKGNGKSVAISRPTVKPVSVVAAAAKQTDVPSVEKIVATPAEKQPEKPHKISREKPKGEVKRAVAEDNVKLIEKYNNSHDGYDGKKQKSSNARCAVAIMGVTLGSVLSNEDVEIELSAIGRRNGASLPYKIYVRNKSDKMIYLDLENCFRVYNDGTFRPYYSGKQIRRDKKSNNKVTVSNKITASHSRRDGGNRISTSYDATLTLDDRVQTSQVVKEQKSIAIPPKGKAALPPRIYLDANDEIVEEYDFFSTTLQYPFNVWQLVNVTESQTPYKNSFIITYSPDKNFDVYSTVNFGLYLKQMIGLGTTFSRFNEKLIKGYDRYTICGEIYFE